MKGSDSFLLTDSMCLCYNDLYGVDRTLCYINLDENGDGEEYSTDSLEHAKKVITDVIDPASSTREYPFNKFKPECIEIVEITESSKVVK